MKRLICLILIVGIHTIYAPTPLSNADSKTRIKFNINSDNSSQRFLNAKAASFLKRELRKFSDVEIVVDSPDYEIVGVAGELTSADGSFWGYIVTITILKRQDLSFWNVNLGYDVFTIWVHQYIYGNDLESMCRDLAVIVDSKVLELERQVRRFGKEAGERFQNEFGIEK